ncbi:MAG: ATP-binding protein [Propionibacteriaceae bacterium]|nr:ATP-binding protein [Propionibacteriaceae bacterium]
MSDGRGDEPLFPRRRASAVALVGRATQMNAWATAIQRVSRGGDAQSLVLYGLRGVGKTVLLSTFSLQARDAGWLTAQVEAKSDSSMRNMVG